MYTVVHQIQEDACIPPQFTEIGRDCPYDSIEQALRITARTHEALRAKYNFQVTRLIGVRDLRTGRFVA